MPISLLRVPAAARTAWLPRLWWLVLLALVLQVAVVYGPGKALGDGRRWLVLASYFALCPVVLANWRNWGIRIMGAGLAMNLLAMVANGGWMPITSEVLGRAGLSFLAEAADGAGIIPGSKDMLMAREDVRLYGLTDILALRFPWPKVYSPGDFVLAAGLVVAVLQFFWHVAAQRMLLGGGRAADAKNRTWA